ncbi:MAG: type II secretion system minor pseudopilin GspI [Wenzhouxiangellaceae bacterium]|nr:type II secretion system minor pseudopilin GspI [Wenzhouxiangellaceae bacterium]
MKRTGAEAGFTLIEVLVALVIVAVALGALGKAAGRALDTQQQIELRTMALWVADNQLAEIGLARPIRPGTRTGSSRMGGRDWRWQSRIEPAPGEQIWRVDVVVFDGADQPLFTHTGFIAP